MNVFVIGRYADIAGVFADKEKAANALTAEIMEEIPPSWDVDDPEDHVKLLRELGYWLEEWKVEQ